MNVGMILDNNFPPDPRVENEAVTLLKHGNTVSLFSLNFDSQPNYENLNGIVVRRYKISRMLFNKLSPLAYTFPFYFALLSRKISDFVESNNFDVLHIHDMAIAELVFKLNKKWNLPIILDLHENRPEIMKFYSHVNTGLGKILINLSKWKRKQNELILKAENVIVVSNEQKNDIIKETKIEKETICVVPNSVISEIFLHSKIDQKIMTRYKNKFVILYIGSTGLRRGTDTAIKSISILHKHIQNIKLVVVGSSREDNYFKNLAEKYKISEFIDFEGWQNFDLFPSYISASDICISPLVRNKHHDSTYTNKQFQYMAMAKPLIVSDSITQANVVRDANCGLIHKGSDENDLAEKITTLYKNKNLRLEYGRNALTAFKEKYNWEKTSVNLVELYNNLNKNNYNK